MTGSGPLANAIVTAVSSCGARSWRPGTVLSSDCLTPKRRGNSLITRTPRSARSISVAMALPGDDRPFAASDAANAGASGAGADETVDSTGGRSGAGDERRTATTSPIAVTRTIPAASAQRGASAARCSSRCRHCGRAVTTARAGKRSETVNQPFGRMSLSICLDDAVVSND